MKKKVEKNSTPIMESVKISELNETLVLKEDDLIPVVQDGETKKFKTKVLHGLKTKIADNFEGGADEALSVVKGGELNTRVTQLEDLSMFYQERESEGTVTWTNSYVGDIKDLVIKGKTIGGYNAETEQFDTIVSSCEGENNVLKVRTTGKNLSKTKTVTFDKNKGTTRFIDIDTNEIDISKTYRISTNQPRFVHLYATFKDGGKKAFLHSAPIKFDKEVQKIQLYINDDIYNAQVVVADNIQLEEGTIATDYVPYIEDKREIQLPCPHRQDNIYNGETGAYTEVTTLKKYVGLANEDIRLFKQNETLITFYIVEREYVGGMEFGALSNKFKSISDAEAFSGKFEGIGTSHTQGNKNILITLKKAELTTLDVDGFKNLLRKWEQEGDALKIQFKLATPIMHNIEKLPPLKSYKGATHITLDNEIKGNISAKVKVDLPAVAAKLENENKQLKQDLEVKGKYFHGNDLELTNSDIEMDFRLMEVEFALDVPINLNMKGDRNMAARTPYEMMKIVIVGGGNYDRADYEYKISIYVKRGRMTQEEADELIALMDAKEITQ